MLAIPWRSFGTVDANSEYVAMVSYLPLKSYWKVFPFMVYTAQVINQLKSSEGLVGFSLLAHPFSKKFWTLSAWKNNEALQSFVQQKPHARMMNELAAHMEKTKFVFYRVKGPELPLRWDDALQRVQNG